MKRFLASLIVPAALIAAAAENPIYKMYSDEITFSASFTDTMEADMANGKGEIKRVMTKDPATYKPGMFGKAIFGVDIMYDPMGNIDTTVPGSVVVWAAPTWSSEKKPKEPGFSLFGVHAYSKDQIYDLIFGKMSHQPWNKGHLNAYVQYPKLKKVTSCIIWNRGMVEQWPAGQWHMFVVTWGNGTITYSVDGKKSSVSELLEVLKAKPQWFTIRANSFMVDEVTVLNKRLTDEEIAKLYQECLNAAKK